MLEEMGYYPQTYAFNSLGSLVDRLFLAVPELYAPLKPKRKITRELYEGQLDFYIDNGYTDNPGSFFTFPMETPPYSIAERRPYHDGESQTIVYESGYLAKNPLIRERYHAFEANRSGYLVRWTHGDRGRKTVLCHHGYMLGEPRQARKMFRVKSLFSMGLDVALFIAPFHWRRATGSLMQRGLYLQPDDPAMTCECVAQAMHDLYSAFRILRDMGASETGMIGASLGGYNTALFISLTVLASFGAMMVPAVNFGGPMDPTAARLPFPVDNKLRGKIRRVWEFHSPFNFTPKIPLQKILVVASQGDLLCPFDDVRRLCEKWKIPNRHFLNGGHWLIFNPSERGRAWYRFLVDQGFITM